MIDTNSSKSTYIDVDIFLYFFRIVGQSQNISTELIVLRKIAMSKYKVEFLNLLINITNIY